MEGVPSGSGGLAARFAVNSTGLIRIRESRIGLFSCDAPESREGAYVMANLIIEVPDHLARSLERMAAAQRKTLQQLAVERLSSLVEAGPTARAGSPLAILRVMLETPHPSVSDVDELDAAIAAGRLPVHTPDLFSE